MKKFVLLLLFVFASILILITNQPADAPIEDCENSYEEFSALVKYVSSFRPYLYDEGIILAVIAGDMKQECIYVTVVDLDDEKQRRIQEVIDCDILKFSNITSEEYSENFNPR